MKNLKNIDLINKLNFLWIELTEKCNLACTHCYADSDSSHNLNGTMTFESWKNTILDAYLLGCKNLQFAGGEPTIHPSLGELIRFSKNLGYESIEIHTNAVSISDRLFEIIKENQVEIGISFYSYKPEIHDAITRIKGSFQKTLKNIRKIKQNEIPLRISIVKMEENKDDIEQTVEFIKNEGVDRLGFDNIRAIGRGNKKNVKIETSELCGRCWEGSLVVNSNGDIYLCPLSRFNILDNIKNGLKNTMANPTILKFRQEVYQQSVERNGIDIACMINCPPGWGCRPKK